MTTGLAPHKFNTSDEIRQWKWDIRYLQLAKFVSSWSKDPSTKVGAAIIRPDLSVCSVGFNGFPQNMEDDPALYANREEKLSRVVHAEVNAVSFADSKPRGYHLYTWPFAPCDRCCVQMLQMGIARFIWPTPSADALTRWAAAFERTKQYIVGAGVDYMEIPAEEINGEIRQT